MRDLMVIIEKLCPLGHEVVAVKYYTKYQCFPSILDYITYKQFNYMVTWEVWMKKGYLKELGMVSAWKKKKENTLKFVDAGSKTWDREKVISSMEWADKEESRRKL